MSVFHCLGYVQGTLRYEMRSLKQVYDYIIHHHLGSDECSTLYKLYMEWKEKLDTLLATYSIAYRDSEYLSGLNDAVDRYMKQTCPNHITACANLTHEETVCDLDQFRVYFQSNVIGNQTLQEEIDFHDSHKRNARYAYPCSVNVYKDFTTNGYIYKMGNRKQTDGTCKQVITAHTEHDKFPTFN
jgi:hypothetical protein